MKYCIICLNRPAKIGSCCIECHRDLLGCNCEEKELDEK